ncbi:hypothetical protein LTR20_007051 [Exophiala xenobiotica]|nr:hypothetical protein LTS06_011396 [Exophiala xenobiotica]KAK5259886.1 hypothetical protein LTR40_005141 [Exophiala xenobiotica]KAK5380507.1 hypothetical protein LTS13_003365 [Exophiala xenobiotica]KAK5393000.1 hypothetical protein LTR79_009904 [Exophiala xenobiotica]KAK5412054.1 hypothetical protein LTR90_007616 [Exophiala xenobiotica]
MSGIEVIGFVLGVSSFVGQMAHLINKVRHRRQENRAVMADVRRRSDGSAMDSFIVALGRTHESAQDALIIYNESVLATLGNLFTIQQQSNQTAFVAMVQESRRFSQIIIFLATMLAALMYVLGFYQAERDMLRSMATRPISMDGDFPLPRSTSSTDSDPLIEGVLRFINAVVKGVLYVPAGIAYGFNGALDHLAYYFQKCSLWIGLLILWPFNLIYDLLFALLALIGVPATLSQAMLFGAGAKFTKNLVFYRKFDPELGSRHCSHRVSLSDEIVCVSISGVFVTILSRSLLDLGLPGTAVYALDGAIALRLVYVSRILCGKSFLFCHEGSQGDYKR